MKGGGIMLKEIEGLYFEAHKDKGVEPPDEKAQKIIQEFERNTPNPGTSTYEVRRRPDGGRVVVKQKPSGEEVHVDAP